MAQSRRSTVVPRQDSRGTDVFRNDSGDCVIRSDLGCYLQTPDFLEKGSNIKIRRLHPACQGGDHYVASRENPDIYILKGDSYRVVQDLSTDRGAQIFQLHPRCRGGDHYGRLRWAFFIIFQGRGVIRRVDDLSTAGGETDLVLPPEYRTGLYYFGIDQYLTIIKLDEKWGVQFFLYGDERFQFLDSYFSIHPNVLNFFPGGLACTQGALTAGWECIKTLHNTSDSTITWSDKVVRKVGYTKQQMSSIEYSWSISADMSLGIGDLTKLITQLQFSLNTEYGGRSVRTEQEDWNEAQDEEESIQVPLDPQKSLYIWQYHLGIGQKPVLFCRDMQFTKEDIPPDHIPLPPVL